MGPRELDVHARIDYQGATPAGEANLFVKFGFQVPMPRNSESVGLKSSFITTMRSLNLLLIFFLAAAASFAQSIPAFKAKALDNSEVSLPASGGHEVLILVVGFSHKSGDLCQFWDKKISDDFRGDARVGYFILPVLQSAPSLIRPMILHGMRKDVPAGELPHYVPLYAREDEWKKLVSMASPDDPYLIVATADGHVVWQGRGAFSDDVYTELKKSVSGVKEK
jgi:hypothetical protein